MIQSKLLPNIQGLIADHWVGADSGETEAVTNPVDGSHLADVPRMGADETKRAIEAAAQIPRSDYSLEQRQGWLTTIAEAMLTDKEELARIITLEHGKPLKEAVAEVEYSAGFFQFCATAIDHLAPHDFPEPIRGCRWRLHWRPAGVAGLITPWNFPLAMMAKKLAPAIAAGCGIVVKPASITPLSAIAFCTIAGGSGLPGGMINLVIGKAQPIGQVICSHPDVRIISFTGSTEVGVKLAVAAAPHLKRMALELGGNAPFIVFADADVTAAADALMANKFRSGGQTCVCANRVYVHRDILEPFTAAVATRVEALRMGDGIAPDTDIGPLINRAGFDKVSEHVADAISRGATRLVGDDPPRPAEDWGCFYPPTVLTGVRPEMLVCRDETFGPVVAISEFDDDAQVIEQANGTEYGLAAYLFTANEDRAARSAAQLQFGHVGINTGTGPAPQAPFGGMKQSGFGREGGVEGMLEFCEPQVVVRG